MSPAPRNAPVAALSIPRAIDATAPIRTNGTVAATVSGSDVSNRAIGGEKITITVARRRKERTDSRMISFPYATAVSFSSAPRCRPTRLLEAILNPPREAVNQASDSPPNFERGDADRTEDRSDGQ